jgi:hypothetical protein
VLTVTRLNIFLLMLKFRVYVALDAKDKCDT